MREPIHFSYYCPFTVVLNVLIQLYVVIQSSQLTKLTSSISWARFSSSSPSFPIRSFSVFHLSCLSTNILFSLLSSSWSLLSWASLASKAAESSARRTRTISCSASNYIKRWWKNAEYCTCVFPLPSLSPQNSQVQKVISIIFRVFRLEIFKIVVCWRMCKYLNNILTSIVHRKLTFHIFLWIFTLFSPTLNYFKHSQRATAFF